MAHHHRLQNLERQIGIHRAITVPKPTSEEALTMLEFMQQFAYRAPSPLHAYGEALRRTENPKCFSLDQMDILIDYYAGWSPPFDATPGREVLKRGGNPFEELGFRLLSDRSIIPPGYYTTITDFYEAPRDAERVTT